ncbi:hypothetical protein BA724_04435 [Domibacillus iocasae]|uniref:Uncharacterized protein n=1 Tax=Domibacillus iocasae TaxID=1714016 RepID=A0A1E7DQA5_9BACI|nr:hypothetical protein BA724_04435 [Domibacillus iocasae]
MTTLSREEKVFKAIEAARQRQGQLEYKMEIPSFIRRQAKSKDDYIRWVRSYFRSVHSDLQLMRIEKKYGILIKQNNRE